MEFRLKVQKARGSAGEGCALQAACLLQPSSFFPLCLTTTKLPTKLGPLAYQGGLCFAPVGGWRPPESQPLSALLCCC